MRHIILDRSGRDPPEVAIREPPRPPAKARNYDGSGLGVHVGVQLDAANAERVQIFMLAGSASRVCNQPERIEQWEALPVVGLETKPGDAWPWRSAKITQVEPVLKSRDVDR